MNPETPKLAIVVGTYNRLDQIQRCVESILRETTTPFVLFITDAGSTDGTVKYLESIRSDVIKPLLVGKLLGQAKAYNDVFALVTTPYVCWLSDDNVVVNRGLDIAFDILEYDQRIGMVGLKTRDVQGPFVDAPYIGGISEVGILNVNQGMLRTPVLNKVAGFSEAFRDYGIDPDLTAKVLFSGYDIVYTKPVSLHHYRNWSTDKSSPEYKNIKEKNDRARKLYANKYSQFLRTSPILKLKQTARFAIKKAKFPSVGRTKKLVASNFSRDWSNILSGRYISLLDSVLYCGKKYHLRQRCPKYLLPSSLPDDPEL
ncbi:glycosyltransferase [Methylobacter sp.]|uniref:glycosyltransferase family 2 protein n=1 Tax=Methylobacter sp. TaxID=2051955 RepID=UPI0012041442|nr:glycosyltransferase [Methylobacter sp.]TAK64234.1 MAG: glycosyltransferase [Methylobacter sp.]